MGNLQFIFVCFVSLIVGTCFCSHLKDQERDKINWLPVQPENVEFNQYSGYVTVNKRAGRALFYWFTESPKSRAPESRALVLWLNGGPCCSSIAYGAAEEIGPFRIRSDGKTLYLNPYAWNKLANIIFLESPAGVGFSYTNRTSDLYDSGDKRTGFHSTSIEISTLLEKVMQVTMFLSCLKLYMKETGGVHNPVINFKGFLVGNAVTDDHHDYIGTFEYWWTHGLISDSTNRKLRAACDMASSMHPSAECRSALGLASEEQGIIDTYSIFTQPCSGSGELRRNLRGHYLICLSNSPATSLYANDTDMVLSAHSPWMSRGYDPCTVRYSEEYFNLPQVQKALHANLDAPLSMLPIYQELIAAGFRIWLFSGDTDAMVPLTATRRSINALKLPTIANWYAWYDNGKVGGWSQV
ncbi:hypothetical protein SLEP1_g42530 [Rubroshorea leprosula]|uniref:Uncharacterized protein n=1 Tax=Rubroshorea leprosula TaxID=152421 RepID=A0AAV5LA74_9ROSI|nr:hypothetical protein SLEP1_g42530 [Rubroshorea leprosula]